MSIVMRPLRTFHATAPIRICDNGGWTDTWAARHGKVFNIAVQPLVAVRVDVFPPHSRDARVVFDVRDRGMRYAPDLCATGWGPHPLLEAALREIRPREDVDIDVTITSDAPAGASTGTSAAVVVALLGALDHLGGPCRSRQEIAAAAHAVETVHLGQQSGIQDQLCAAFGGANFIDIREYPRAVVTPLPLPDPIRHELDRRLALIYLGRPHRSSAVHEKVMKNLERLGPDCAPLDRLRRAAELARDALVAGDIAALGSAMRENTSVQAELHPELVHQDAWRAIEIAEAHGAAGWKVNGAGGDGGSMTFLGNDTPGSTHAMVQAIVADNPRLVPIPIQISREGLRVCD
jgi:D-glycero-alpha-D-manno-heptose-7-phosphate kinase